MSIRKTRRRFERIRRQRYRFAKVANQPVADTPIPLAMLFAYNRYARAVSVAFWARHTGTAWGRRHPKPGPMRWPRWSGAKRSALGLEDRAYVGVAEAAARENGR